MEISVLGPLAVKDDSGRRIELPRGLERHLVSVLALSRAPVPADRLISTLWKPDDYDRRSALTSLIHRLRSDMPHGRIVRRDRGFELERRPGDSFDIDDFCRLAEEAKEECTRRRLPRAAELFRQAWRLWRDDPGEPDAIELPDTDPARRSCLSLLAKRREIFLSYVEIRLRLGEQSAELGEEIRQFLERDPTDENLYSLLMQNEYRDGRTAAALQAFNDAADTLMATVGAAPGRILTQAKADITAGRMNWSVVSSTETGQATSAGVTAAMMQGQEGKNALRSDRRLVGRIIEAVPEAEQFLPLTRENRTCITRMARFMTEGRVKQFIDLGCGLPLSHGNVHEVTQSLEPDARVVYVDNDARVAAHMRALLVNDRAGVHFIEGDIRDPAMVLAECKRYLDYRAPVGIIFSNVLEHLGESTETLGTCALTGTIQRYLNATAVGSCLAITTVTSDGMLPELRPYLDATHEVDEVDRGHRHPMYLRSMEQIASLFCELRLVDPGLVQVADWPVGPMSGRDGPLRMLAGLAAKSESSVDG